MNAFKKLALFCLTVLSVGSLSVAVACGGETSSSSSSSITQSSTTTTSSVSSTDESVSSAQTSESSSESVEESSSITEESSASESIEESSSEESSSEESSSEESSSEDSSSSSSESSEEEFTPIFPDNDATITYQTPSSGTGGEYDRFECAEGYCELTLPKANVEYFFSFSVSQSGRYALYSTEKARNVTVTRYAASSAYITKPGEPALELDGYVFYSLVNCSDAEFGPEWRATFGIKATANNKTVKVRFVRVADPVNVPKSYVTDILPTEIKGVADTPVSRIPVDVPWASSYFFDANATLQVTPFGGGTPVEVKGFYRMGTPEKPGDIIYAAVDAPSRLFDTTFSGAQDNGNALTLYVGLMPNNFDYQLHSYIDFITNDSGGETAEDPLKACYANAANEDGLYPVNQELYTFLNAYVKVHPPFLDDDVVVSDSNLWLAACFYYKQAALGTVYNPYSLTENGENKLTLPTETWKYAIVKWVSTSEYDKSGYFTLSCDTEGVVLKIFDNENLTFYAPFSVTVETDSTKGRTLYVGTLEDVGEFTISVQKTEGSLANPYVLTELGEQELTVNTVYLLDGTVAYKAEYTLFVPVASGATADKTFSLQCGDDTADVSLTAVSVYEGEEDAQVYTGANITVSVITQAPLTTPLSITITMS